MKMNEWCFILFLLIPVLGQGQDTTRVTAPSDPIADYSTKYTFLPFVAYSPDTRLMFGGLALGQFKTRNAGIDTRSSNIQLSATYTLNQQLSLQLRHYIFYPGEHWIWNGETIYSKFPRNYWGIGPHTTEEDKMKISYRKVELRQEGLRKIGENLYLGPQWHFIHMYDLSFEEPRPSVTGAEGGSSHGLGFAANWDRRDHVLTPTRNHFLRFSALFYSSLLFGDFDYQQFQLDARKYFSPGDGKTHVLAFQALLVSTFGEVPFEQLGFIGGENMMRGFIEGRFRDKHTLEAQGEYRRIVFGRFGAVVFAAIGNVAPAPNKFSTENIKWAAGAGLRYNVNKEDPTYIRLDYGLGINTSGFYLTLGEAF